MFTFEKDLSDVYIWKCKGIYSIRVWIAQAELNPTLLFVLWWVLYDLGLVHEENMHKMRLLSFMQMCEDHQEEIDFVSIQNELLLKPNEVESFIIDGKRYSR